MPIPYWLSLVHLIGCPDVEFSKTRQFMTFLAVLATTKEQFLLLLLPLVDYSGLVVGLWIGRHAECRCGGSPSIIAFGTILGSMEEALLVLTQDHF